MTAKERHEKHRKTEKYKTNRRRYMAAYRKSSRGREVLRAFANKYNADPANRERIKRKRAKYRATARSAAVELRQVLRSRYGLSVEQFEAMVQRQGSACAVCGGGNRGLRRLCVDHDHKTGKVRGLLCHSCNTVLGRMRDNSALLRKAAAYLDRHVLEDLV